MWENGLWLALASSRGRGSGGSQCEAPTVQCPPAPSLAKEREVKIQEYSERKVSAAFLSQIIFIGENLARTTVSEPTIC